MDIYDREAKDGLDKFLCRGSVPFREAWEATKVSKGFSTPKTVDLTPRRPSDGKLQLSFSSAINKDYLIVNVLSADKLPGREPSGVANAYCVVRLADLGQLGDPTDQASASLPSAASMPGDFLDASRSLLVQQEACQDGLVAARAGWHLKFDVVDKKKQLVLCSSSISVQQDAGAGGPG